MSNLTTVDSQTILAALDSAIGNISVGDDVPILKLTKVGQWQFGSDETPIEEGSEWALNPASIKLGYIAWGNGDLLGEELRPFFDKPVTLAELPDVGARWQQQISVEMQCLSGEDEGTVVRYPTSSKGGLAALKRLIESMRTRVSSGKIVPCFTLEVSSYKHKEFGRIFTPEFHVKRWVDMDDEKGAKAAEEKPMLEADTPPRKPAARKAEAEAEAPARRRRVRS